MLLLVKEGLSLGFAEVCLWLNLCQNWLISVASWEFCNFWMPTDITSLHEALVGGKKNLTYHVTYLITQESKDSVLPL